ncbi:MAG: hypothetical protein IJU86_01035 [Firmicutes bacterium]|nr:hypothetical protein [Bacillota bacterium]
MQRQELEAMLRNPSLNNEQLNASDICKLLDALREHGRRTIGTEKLLSAELTVVSKLKEDVKQRILSGLPEMPLESEHSGEEHLH